MEIGRDHVERRSDDRIESRGCPAQEERDEIIDDNLFATGIVGTRQGSIEIASVEIERCK